MPLARYNPQGGYVLLVKEAARGLLPASVTPGTNAIALDYLTEDNAPNREILPRKATHGGDSIAGVADAYKLGGGQLKLEVVSPDQLHWPLGTLFQAATSSTLSSGRYNHIFYSDGSGATPWPRSVALYISRNDGAPMWVGDVVLSELKLSAAAGQLVGADCTFVAGQVSSYGRPVRTEGAGTASAQIRGWDALGRLLEDGSADYVLAVPDLGPPYLVTSTQGAGDPVEDIAVVPATWSPLYLAAAPGLEPVLYLPDTGIAADDVFAVPSREVELDQVYGADLPIAQIFARVVINGITTLWTSFDLSLYDRWESVIPGGSLFPTGRRSKGEKGCTLSFKRPRGAEADDETNKAWDILKAVTLADDVTVTLDTGQGRGVSAADTYRVVLSGASWQAGGAVPGSNKGAGTPDETLDLTPIGAYTVTLYNKRVGG